MSEVRQLTERQREILDFITDKIENRGYGPTVREIGEAFGIKSPNGVMCHLKALEKKGLIKREEHSARAIQIMDHSPGWRGLPMLGTVAAGTPTQAIAHEDRIEFQELFGGPERFVLKVSGNSMIENHIEDGDCVVIKKQEFAENGERVVAMIDNEVTLKTFFKEKGHVRLEPANGQMTPIIVDPSQNAQILGVLVGVMRKYA